MIVRLTFFKKVLFISFFCQIVLNISLNGQLDSLKGIVSTLPNGKEKADIYKDIAFAHYNNQPDIALRYCDTLAQLAIEINYPNRLYSAYYLRGLAYFTKGDYSKALSNTEKAIQGYQPIDELAMSLSVSYELMGTIYNKMNLPNKATEALLKAMEVSESIKDTVGIASISINIGALFFERSNISSARKYYLQAIELLKPLGWHNQLAMAYEGLSIASTKLEPQKAATYLEGLN